MAAAHNLDSATSTPNLMPEKETESGEMTALALPASRGSAVPSAPPVLNQQALLQKEASIDPAESYGEDEKALNAFIRLHPMLSMLSTGHAVLNKLADMIPKVAIRDRPVELCTKAHDDLFLRCDPALRPCIPKNGWNTLLYKPV